MLFTDFSKEQIADIIREDEKNWTDKPAQELEQE